MNLALVTKAAEDSLQNSGLIINIIMSDILVWTSWSGVPDAHTTAKLMK